MVFRLLEGYTVTPDGDGAKTFGVIVLPESTTPMTQAICSEPPNFLYRNPDITFDRSEMLHHISLWNEFQPTLQQLEELIADLIESNYSVT